MDELRKSLTAQFSELASQLEFPVTQTQQSKLIEFVLLLHKWNKTYNLSSVRQPEEMLVKHILDSIVVAPYLNGSHIADVGTGPGLPGIPLAIMCPEKSFTLIDSLGKRVRFMKQAIHELNLENAIPIQSRVEDVLPDLVYDVVLSRAFASLNDMLHWCKHLIDKEGMFLALKGQLHQQELNEIPAQFTLVQSIPLLIPSFNGDRHLVEIKMTKA
ncbi:MAG: 16S rRNA (guanine527-N7)-methyltransferase [Alphaproteobacteria bacterium]